MTASEVITSSSAGTALRVVNPSGTALQVTASEVITSSSAGTALRVVNPAPTALQVTASEVITSSSAGTALQVVNTAANTWTWPYIQESLSVKAAIAGLDNVQKVVVGEANTPLDVRLFISPDAMPLDNLITELRTRRIPATTFLGEVFSRRVYRELPFYYSNRNRFSGVNKFAVDAQFRYSSEWVLTGVARTGIELCITPSPFADADQSYVYGVTQWINWLLPHFEGDVTVTICVFAELGLRLYIAQPVVTIIKTIVVTQRQ